MQATLSRDVRQQPLFDNDPISGTAWFYEVDGARVGPVTPNRFLDLLLSKSIVDETLVWRPGLPDWVRAASLAELRQHLAQGLQPLTLPEASSRRARWPRMIVRLFERKFRH